MLSINEFSSYPLSFSAAAGLLRTSPINNHKPHFLNLFLVA